VGSLASRALLFVVNIQLARVLSPEHYGKVVLAQTVLLFGTVVSDLGGRTVMIREVGAVDGAVRPGVVGNAWAGLLVLAGAGVLLMIGGAAFVGERTEGILILLFALALPAYWLNLDWLLKGQRRFKHVGVTEIVKAAVYLGMVGVWLRTPDDILLVPVAYAVGWAAGAAYTTMVVGWNALPKIQFERGAIQRLVAAGLPIGITGILTQLYMNAGIVFLKAFVDSTAVGIYGAAFKLTLLVTLMAALFSETLLPSLASRYAVSEAEGRRLVRLAFSAVLAVGALAALVFAVFSREILVLVYGQAYASAAPVLVLLGLSIVPLFCNVPFVNMLIVTGRQRFLLLGAVIGCAVNAAVNLALTPRYGPVGAAAAELATETGVAASLAAFALMPPRRTPRQRADDLTSTPFDRGNSRSA
jgi:O-antigen/teichoic acid export membrane protein